MLVLTRKSEQSVIIGRTIEVKILGIRGDQVSLGFSAPDDVSIYRKEVYAAIQLQNQQSVQHGDITLQVLSDAFNNLISVREKQPPQEKGGTNNHIKNTAS